MDHTTGIFTCSIPGYYYFSLSFWPAHGNRLEIRLYQNTENKAILRQKEDTDISGGRYSTKTMGVTLHLQVGDEVKLKAYSDTKISGGTPNNIFTGFLIHAT